MSRSPLGFGYCVKRSGIDDNIFLDQLTQFDLDRTREHWLWRSRYLFETFHSEIRPGSEEIRSYDCSSRLESSRLVSYAERPLHCRRRNVVVQDGHEGTSHPIAFSSGTLSRESPGLNWLTILIFSAGSHLRILKQIDFFFWRKTSYLGSSGDLYSFNQS
mmetsp:Transcript_10587/g.21324  ORF Transcript_10587/g.21324 Transcript_10587/m.21324 type:complete len:160 (+) Transcript_10587:1054-1533(+)